MRTDLSYKPCDWDSSSHSRPTVENDYILVVKYTWLWFKNWFVTSSTFLFINYTPGKDHYYISVVNCSNIAVE